MSVMASLSYFFDPVPVDPVSPVSSGRPVSVSDRSDLGGHGLATGGFVISQRDKNPG